MRSRVDFLRLALLPALFIALTNALADKLPAQTTATVAVRTSCVISGLVLDSQKQPLSGARLRLLGTTDSTQSNDDGTFRLRSCASGRKIETRRLGYAPDTSVIGLIGSAGDSSLAWATHTVVLRAVPLSLSTQVIKARLGGVGLLSSGFFERREKGFGVFLGPEQLIRRLATDVTQLLRGMPGVTVDSRPGAQMRLTVRQCGNPTIWMDGVRMRGSYVLEVIDPRTIEGIEVYRGFSEMPAQFHDPSGCGAIVFWSKTAAPR